jgi:hypothetical protein
MIRSHQRTERDHATPQSVMPCCSAAPKTGLLTSSTRTPLSHDCMSRSIAINWKPVDPAENDVSVTHWADMFERASMEHLCAVRTASRSTGRCSLRVFHAHDTVGNEREGSGSAISSSAFRPHLAGSDSPQMCRCSACRDSPRSST